MSVTLTKTNTWKKNSNNKDQSSLHSSKNLKIIIKNNLSIITYISISHQHLLCIGLASFSKHFIECSPNFFISHFFFNPKIKKKKDKKKAFLSILRLDLKQGISHQACSGHLSADPSWPLIRLAVDFLNARLRWQSFAAWGSQTRAAGRLRFLRECSQDTTWIDFLCSDRSSLTGTVAASLHVSFGC